MIPDRLDLLFAAEVSCRYHQRRATVLAFLDKAINWLSLLVATSAFLFLVGGENTAPAKYATAIVGVLTITQLGFNLGKSATLHEVWHSRWCDLLVEIQTTPAPTRPALNRWLATRKTIEAEHPHELKALAVDCRNRAIEALELEECELRVIRWWQRPLLHLVSLQTFYPRVNPPEKPAEGA